MRGGRAVFAHESVVARAGLLERSLLVHLPAQRVEHALGRRRLVSSQRDLGCAETRPLVVGVDREHLLVHAHGELVLAREHHLVAQFDARRRVLGLDLGQLGHRAAGAFAVAELRLAPHEVQAPLDLVGVVLDQHLQVRKGFVGPLQVEQHRRGEAAVLRVAHVQGLQVHAPDLAGGDIVARPGQHARQERRAVDVLGVATHHRLELLGRLGVVAAVDVRVGQVATRVEVGGRQAHELLVAQARFLEAIGFDQQAGVLDQRLAVAGMHLQELLVQRERLVEASELVRVARGAQQDVALQLVAALHASALHLRGR